MSTKVKKLSTKKTFYLGFNLYGDRDLDDYDFSSNKKSLGSGWDFKVEITVPVWNKPSRTQTVEFKE